MYLCDTGVESEGWRQSMNRTRSLAAVVAVVHTDGVLLVAHTHGVSEKVAAGKPGNGMGRVVSSRVLVRGDGGQPAGLRGL